MLGGILLAFTGVETLFADLGAFSLRAIQLSWLFWAYPCLLLAYIGQAAHIAVNPDAYSSPFFKPLPPGMLYPGLIIAVLAAIVASQVMIIATFQLASQILKLSYSPQLKIVHTSHTFHGQLYVPCLNWILLLGKILVTTVYSNTTRLGAAYGVCVMFVTFFDTCMVALVSPIVWRLPIWLVFVPFLLYAAIDWLYLSSALLKVPDGAWFTLTVATILSLLFLLWWFGKEQQWKAEAEDRIHVSILLVSDDDGAREGQAGRLRLTPRWGSDVLSSSHAMAIFFDKTGAMTPSVFTQFLSRIGTVPDVSVFFHLHPVEVPSVPSAQLYVVRRFPTVPGCYRVIVRHGFMDEIITPDLAALVYDKVRGFVLRQAVVTGTRDLEAGGGERKHDIQDGRAQDELARLDTAYANKVIYVVGKGQMKIRDKTALWRRGVLGISLWIRENTRGKVANLRLSMERLVEVGFVKEM